MSIDSFQQQLSTPEGFASSVKTKSGLLGGAITSLVAGAVGIGMNLFQLGTASDWDWPIMFKYFFQADAIQFEGRRAGRAEFWHFLYVWGPVVLIPLGIILLIMHFVTRNSAGAKLFNDYQARGFLARQRETALTIPNGRNQVPASLYANANAPEGEVNNNAAQFSQWLGSLDKKSLKTASQTAVKAGVGKGVSAAQVNQNLPADYVFGPKVPSELVVVIPPASAGGTFKFLPLK